VLHPEATIRKPTGSRFFHRHDASAAAFRRSPD
jgi:hypothetical protein